jgi:peptidoglycan/LPS O-acetylase OafA/YrhL
VNEILIPLAAIVAATGAAIFVCHRLAAEDGHTVDRSRLKTIDGLRAFLALWVLFSHFPNAWGMALTGKWGPQSSPWMLRNFGDVAVTAFFMITGMLFYGKIKREGPRISWRKSPTEN